MSKEGIGVFILIRQSEAIPPFSIRYSKFCGSAVRFPSPQRATRNPQLATRYSLFIFLKKICL